MLSGNKKKLLLTRFNKITGQFKGIQKMIEEPRYCPEILNQVAAVRRALDGLSLFLLEDHMETCVTDAIKKNRGKMHIKELVETIDRFIR